MPHLARAAMVPVLAVLAACSGSSTDTVDGAGVPRPGPSATFTAGKVPILMPGAPGEQAAVIAPGQAGTMANAASYGDADVRFVTGMVGHHAQALELAGLAQGRVADSRVKALASRIAAGQGPEIKAMQAWLSEQGLPAAPARSGHGGAHRRDGDGAVHGLASAPEVDRLKGSRGPAFDRLFLTLMTRHHVGALKMADDAVGAVHPQVTEMVTDTVATQGAEITRMQRVLGALPAATTAGG